jgi:hypothetical protein
MDIQSNALNLSASGVHHFNDHYDYRLKLKLSQILYRKARRARQSEFQVAEDETDRRTLFLKIHDDGSGATVEMDKEQTAQKIKEDLKEEKSELKVILNKELGLFKKDEEVKRRKRQEGQQEEELFRFRFDEEEPDSSRKSGPGTKKDTAKNKPAAKFVIDE